VLVSSNMEGIAGLVDRLYVLDAGRVALTGTTRDLFARPADLRAHGLDVPPVAAVAHALAARGLPLARLPLTVDEALEEMWTILSSSAT